MVWVDREVLILDRPKRLVAAPVRRGRTARGPAGPVFVVAVAVDVVAVAAETAAAGAQRQERDHQGERVAKGLH